MNRVLLIFLCWMCSAAAMAQPGHIYRSMEEVKDPSQVFHLQLHGKRLNAIPPEVYEMTNLEVLDLRNNKIAHLSDSIALLSHLRSLDVSRNPLRDVPPALAQLQTLEELVLWATYVTAIPEELAALDATLQRIDLRSCPLTYDDQQEIERQIPSVKKIWNYACNCSD